MPPTTNKMDYTVTITTHAVETTTETETEQELAGMLSLL